MLHRLLHLLFLPTAVAAAGTGADALLGRWLSWPAAGHCEAGVDGCSSTGFQYAQAVPADRGDPFLENWRKLPPIVNETFDDPSTAWKTASGEWRFIGNSRIDRTTLSQSPIFATNGSSFRGPWRRVGLVEGLAWGECPSLYPLPALYPGAVATATSSRAQAALPTHVHKRSRQTHNCSGDCSGDVVQLGNWVDGAPGQVGSWSAAPGVPSEPTIIDMGNRWARLCPPVTGWLSLWPRRFCWL
eukprot:COSAG01_NODE_925_length_12707_cov_21.250297_4_plen_243_part_00